MALLGIDLGTSGVRACLAGPDGMEACLHLVIADEILHIPFTFLKEELSEAKGEAQVLPCRRQLDSFVELRPRGEA